MDRRNFIRIVGLGVATATLSSTLSACSDNTNKVDYGWNGPTASESDIRLKLLAYAILAPNPHNKQPWLVKLIDSNRIELLVDQSRLLPETDPLARQIHIGQGCFLENLAIAASHYGYLADIAYFPQGEYSNRVVELKAVARIDLIKRSDMQEDPLYKQLLIRQSNKRSYDNSYLTGEQKLELKRLPFISNSQLTIVDNEADNGYLQKVLTQAMRIEGTNKQRDLETIKMFRFNDQEIEQYRDGFGLAHSGVSGIKKVIAETFFLDRAKTELDPTQFAQQSVDLAREISESTSTFALLVSKENSRLAQVKAGRDYCRLNLTTTAMGIAQHPMSQVLQEYDDMLPLQAEFKRYFKIDAQHTVQMLVRLGKAPKTEHTPRRLVKNLLLT
ncbi:twin-arginine translocation pathway signal protein [Psychromonas sp. psych-6C06]|uniref:Acg family FMN-binding oxidoreductase n=1 Tax=Psychromonas sp. psych-6C06 TaxID=2058089 RepID=UPI000C331900|nr:twin-arginine translocation pathway signal protein [Psychromonas sp. psych-6C06]PKF63434.1 twin-arginine translocation pathway signal protein [Psychromonas sp. psych-6C06]